MLLFLGGFSCLAVDRYLPRIGKCTASGLNLKLRLPVPSAWEGPQPIAHAILAMLLPPILIGVWTNPIPGGAAVA